MVDQFIDIQSEADIYVALSAIKRILRLHQFSVIDQQKVLVSVSELTRNVLDHAGEPGMVEWEVNHDEIRLWVTDHGKGIQNHQQVLEGKIKNEDSKGLGIGLSGTKRLMDEFLIETNERGTKILVVKRKSPTP